MLSNRKPEALVDIRTSPSATGSDPFAGLFSVVETKKVPKDRRRPGWLSAERQLARARQQGSAAFLTHTPQTSHCVYSKIASFEVATRATVGPFYNTVPGAAACHTCLSRCVAPLSLRGSFNLARPQGVVPGTAAG